MKTFKFYWLDGSVNEGEGLDEADALRRLGYGAGAIRALDYYKRVLNCQHCGTGFEELHSLELHELVCEKNEMFNPELKPDFFGVELVCDVIEHDGPTPIDELADVYLGFFEKREEAQAYIEELLGDGWCRPDGTPLKQEDLLIEPIPFGQHVPLIKETEPKKKE